MAEWSNAAVLKTAEDLRPPWVQIPPSPPNKRGCQQAAPFIWRTERFRAKRGALPRSVYEARFVGACLASERPALPAGRIPETLNGGYLWRLWYPAGGPGPAFREQARSHKPFSPSLLPTSFQLLPNPTPSQASEAKPGAPLRSRNPHPKKCQQ